MAQLTNIRGRWYNVEEDGWPVSVTPHGIAVVAWNTADDTASVCRFSRGFLMGHGRYGAVNVSGSRYRVVLRADAYGASTGAPELHLPGNPHIARALAKALLLVADQLEGGSQSGAATTD